MHVKFIVRENPNRGKGGGSTKLEPAKEILTCVSQPKYSSRIYYFPLLFAPRAEPCPDQLYSLSKQDDRHTRVWRTVLSCTRWVPTPKGTPCIDLDESTRHHLIRKRTEYCTAAV